MTSPRNIPPGHNAAFRFPAIHKVMFQETNGLLTQEAAKDPYIRSLVIQNYAHEFYQATVEQIGTDENRLNDIFKQVHAKGALPEFEQALTRLEKAKGKPVVSAEAIIRQEFGGNLPERVFKGAVKKKLLDYLQHGENRFSASPWEYRRYGMWQSVANFVDVCKAYPVMSAGVIGAVAYLGHKYPFLGGISGIAIIAWGGAASLIHEIKAKLKPSSGQTKTEHYVASGENLAAALITSLGFKGIKNGTINGIEQAKDTITTLSTAKPMPAKLAQASLKAITATSKEQHKTNLLESFLFVSGLFDNVLLPFNTLASQLKRKPE